MNARKEQREELGLSQVDAAARAGVSLATWRRWEEDSAKVSAATRASCERVIESDLSLRSALAAESANFEKIWGNCNYLTPRQAFAISTALLFWADTDIAEWLRNSEREPLHAISPFDQIDLRVMMLVNDNKAWAAAAQQRCYAVANEIKEGVLPFDRPGCYFDELLMALALPYATAFLVDMPEMFNLLSARIAVDTEVSDADEESDTEDDLTLDTDWDSVSDTFDDRCRWDEWEVPVMHEHPLLALILADRHPYSWFDPGQGSGPDYLRQLVGMVSVDLGRG
jgi:transcriptional regulator with XRE-family HTH domain